MEKRNWEIKKSEKGLWYVTYENFIYQVCITENKAKAWIESRA